MNVWIRDSASVIHTKSIPYLQHIGSQSKLRTCQSGQHCVCLCTTWKDLSPIKAVSGILLRCIPGRGITLLLLLSRTCQLTVGIHLSY